MTLQFNFNCQTCFSLDIEINATNNCPYATLCVTAIAMLMSVLCYVSAVMSKLYNMSIKKPFSICLTDWREKKHSLLTMTKKCHSECKRLFVSSWSVLDLCPSNALLPFIRLIEAFLSPVDRHSSHCDPDSQSPHLQTSSTYRKLAETARLW